MDMPNANASYVSLIEKFGFSNIYKPRTASSREISVSHCYTYSCSKEISKSLWSTVAFLTYKKSFFKRSPK